MKAVLLMESVLDTCARSHTHAFLPPPPPSSSSLKASPPPAEGLEEERAAAAAEEEEERGEVPRRFCRLVDRSSPASLSDVEASTPSASSTNPACVARIWRETLIFFFLFELPAIREF